MSAIAAPEIPFSVAVVAVVGLGLAVYVFSKGGISKAVSDAGAAVVSAAGDAAKSTVGAIGATVGLPTPYETTTDPRVARWLIDNVGVWEASKWAGVPALFEASSLPKGSGQPPASNSALGLAFANYASYDETDRLLNRYPAPAKPPTNTTGGVIDIFDPTTYGLGA